MNAINRQLVLNSNTTLLPMSQTPNWHDNYQIGYGVNAVTGEVIPVSALKPFECKPAGIVDTTQSTFLVHDESSFAREFNASEKAGFNFDGLGISQSSDYLSKINYSKVTSTLVSHKIVHSSEFDQVDSAQLELTDSAAALLKKSNVEFRDQFGDYFVQSKKGGSSLTILIVCTAQTTEELTEFNQKAAVGFSNLFSSEEQTKLSELATAYNITLSQKTFVRGANEINPDFDSIKEAQTWFDEHYQLQPMVAYLTSYAAIAQNVKREIDVPQDVFIKINELYVRAALLSSLHNSCQPPYDAALELPYRDFEASLNVSATTLASEPEKLDALLTESNRLINEYEFHANCYGFYCDVKHEATREPAKGHENNADKGLFHYGSNANTLPFNTGDKEITVKTKSQSYQKGYKIGHRKHYFDVLNDDNQFIIGWSVNSKKSDNGHWVKLDNQILTTGRCQINVESGYDRGINYAVDCHYVSREFFNYK